MSNNRQKQPRFHFWAKLVLQTQCQDDGADVSEETVYEGLRIVSSMLETAQLAMEELVAGARKEAKNIYHQVSEYEQGAFLASSHQWFRRWQVANQLYGPLICSERTASLVHGWFREASGENDEHYLQMCRSYSLCRVAT